MADQEHLTELLETLPQDAREMLMRVIEDRTKGEKNFESLVDNLKRGNRLLDAKRLFDALKGGMRNVEMISAMMAQLAAYAIDKDTSSVSIDKKILLDTSDLFVTFATERLRGMQHDPFVEIKEVLKGGQAAKETVIKFAQGDLKNCEAYKGLISNVLSPTNTG